MGPIVCPETSVRSRHCKLRNIPVEPQISSCRSLEVGDFGFCFFNDQYMEKGKGHPATGRGGPRGSG
jgi:hypothetical protein